MEEIAMSKFKATCLAVLNRVSETQEPVLITRRGTPVAKIVPPPVRTPAVLGGMEGTMKIVGDIVSPLGEEDWEV